MPRIDKKKAEKIAEDFLLQYNSTITFESSSLEGDIWIVISKIGLINKKIRRIMIDASTGRILSYNDKEIINNNHVIKKSLISLAVEKALCQIGQPTYEKVIQKLDDEYHCYLPDCYEYPEYLNKIFKEIFGDNYGPTVELIRENLKEFVDQKPVIDFLTAISK